MSALLTASTGSSTVNPELVGGLRKVLGSKDDSEDAWTTAQDWRKKTCGRKKTQGTYADGPGGSHPVLPASWNAFHLVIYFCTIMIRVMIKILLLH